MTGFETRRLVEADVDRSRLLATLLERWPGRPLVMGDRRGASGRRA